MQKACLWGVVCLVLGFAGLGQAQTASFTQVFPQAVDGGSGASRYVSTIWVKNTWGYNSSCSLASPGIDSSRWTATSFTIAPYSFALVRTRGQGAMQSGYVRIACASQVTASLTYAQGDSSLSGMATVFASSAPVTSAFFPMMVGPSIGYRYAVALANDTDTPAQIILTLQLSSTTQTFGQRLTIPAHSNVSKFLDELLPGAPWNTDTFGNLMLEATGASVFHTIGLVFAGPVFATMVPFTQ